MAMTPYGGTTSLPQYLQKRQQTDMVQQPKTAAQTAPAGPTPPPATQQPLSAGANVKPQGANLQNPTANNGMVGGMPAPAQSPGMVGSQPIPPAPPPPAPAMPQAGMQPGGQTVTRTGAQQGAPPPQPQDSFGLPDIIKQMLSQPGRYDNATIQGMRDASRNRLDDERRQSTDRLNANFASRGLLRSSGLMTSLGDVEERFNRGLADSEAEVNRTVADARQQDLLSAINAAFGFGQGQLQNQSQEQNYMLALAQLGLLGGPTIPGAAAGFDTLPQPGVPGQDGGGFWEWLTTMFPQQKAA